MVLCDTTTVNDQPKDQQKLNIESQYFRTDSNDLSLNANDAA